MPDSHLLQIHPADTVAVALAPLKKRQVCTLANGHQIMLADNIPCAHKIALQEISAGDHVIKYGYPIGHATRKITAGQHVHTHNLITNLEGLLEYKYCPNAQIQELSSPRETAYFDGYLRADGSAGTRNELWIIPTVGCVNNTARILAQRALGQCKNRLDGVQAMVHNAGCSQLGNDMAITQNLLKGLVNHPNAGAVLVVSLGCENNCLEYFRKVLGEVDSDRVKFLVTQDVGDEYASGMELIDQLIDYAANFKREKISARKLCMGLKCGSSDPFSGISANPLCGRITDHIVECGGNAILTEVSEMFGAETLLMVRAVNEQVFHQTVELINECKSYFIRYGQPIDRNPCPGNIRSGISTDEDKSLGNIQKGGVAPVVDVLHYGERARKRGLNLLIGSGNDAVSCTNLVASGANLLLFTTGNGNPFGAPVPTIKISSNTALYLHKPDWIDFNAGQVLDGISMDDVTNALFTDLLEVASGRIHTCNERFGYQEISIFRDGVTL